MKIIIATGGTAGHVFPAITIGQCLEKEGHDVLFFGSFKNDTSLISNLGFKVETHKAVGFKFSNIKECYSAILLNISAINKSFNFIKKYKPDVILGFGGYGSFPVVMSALLLRVPTIIHEQNVIPGRANRLLAPLVSSIAISFPQTRKYFKCKKTFLTGLPSHITKSDISKEDIYKKFNFDKNRLTILISGGSQGSEKINKHFLDSLKILRNQLSFQIIHICGVKDFNRLKNIYKESGIPFVLFEFLDRMEYAYEIADIIVSRAGASTINEIAFFKIPAILVPYPHAKGHQKYNALVLFEANLATILDEGDLSAEILAQEIIRLIEHKNNFDNVEKQLEGIFIENAVKNICELVKKFNHEK